MNDSKLKATDKKIVAKRKYAEAISAYITKKPQGIGFVDMMEELKIASPSTLTRNLKILLDEGRIIKIGNLYYPSGADFAVPTFRKIIEVIKKAAMMADAGRGKEPSPAAMIALGELLGTAGHPPPYKYAALPDEHDILTLEKLLVHIISGRIAGMESYMPLLSQFLTACFRFRAQNGMGVSRPLLSEARRIEELLFEHEGIGVSLSNPTRTTDDEDEFKRSAWYFIYTLLCEAKDMQISAILDRILKIPEDESGRMKRENTKKTDGTAGLEKELQSIRHKIRNILWCDQLREVIFNRQFEFFQKQIGSASMPLLADFYGDLRRFAIEEHNPQSGSGDANTKAQGTAQDSG
jgi:hypothetical protein